MTRSHWLSALVVLSCTHVRPTDETVAEHRNDAAIHEARANQELAQFDPKDTVARRPPQTPRVDQVGVPEDLQSYNPTQEHLARADREFIERNEHLSAAHALEQFEARACAGLSKAERSACPLLASSVARVDATKWGLRLNLKPSVDAAQTFARLNCHLAYATAQGFDAPSCPLFVKGTTLRRDGQSIEFVGDTLEIGRQLRTEARRIFVGQAE